MAKSRRGGRTSTKGELPGDVWAQNQASRQAEQKLKNEKQDSEVTRKAEAINKERAKFDPNDGFRSEYLNEQGRISGDFMDQYVRYRSDTIAKGIDKAFKMTKANAKTDIELRQLDFNLDTGQYELLDQKITVTKLPKSKGGRYQVSVAGVSKGEFLEYQKSWLNELLS